MNIIYQTTTTLFSFCLGILLFIVPHNTHSDDKSGCQQFMNKYIFGKVEKINKIENITVRLDALIDSGSTISSMDVRNIQIRAHANDSLWVYFELPTGRDKVIKMIKPLLYFSYVQNYNASVQKRPVITASITIGPVTVTTNFSLTSRSAFKQSVLLGQNTLTNLALVDTSSSYLMDSF